MGEKQIEKDVVLTPIVSEKGFSNYLVDTINGRVWSKKTGKFLKGSPNDNGYVYNTIFDDEGNRYSFGVHRLVLCSFMCLPLELFKRGGLEVDHINSEEKWNNRIDNLQMSSRKMQYRETTRAKMGKGKRLKMDEVCEILEQLDEWKSDENNKLSDFIHMVAEAYGQTYRNIWNIVYGKSWKHLHSEVVSA